MATKGDGRERRVAGVVGPGTYNLLARIGWTKLTCSLVSKNKDGWGGG